MKILLFGGTTEGRQLAAALAALPGAALTVCVATPLGAEELGGLPPAATVLTGRRDAAAMQALLADAQLCIDATHPYAALATANIRAACAAAGVELLRAARPQSDVAGTAVQGGVVRVESCAAAAAYLAGRCGNVLLATGAKELAAFAPLAGPEAGQPGGPCRLYARVLPTHESLAACEALGLPHKNILALQGPFSQKMNEAMLEQYGISWLVTKDGGGPGGFAQKLAAAQNAGAALVLVGRPPEPGRGGESVEDILHKVKARLEGLA